MSMQVTVHYIIVLHKWSILFHLVTGLNKLNQIGSQLEIFREKFLILG